MKLGFFGAGNMSNAIINGILSSFPKTEIFIYSPSGKSAQVLANRYGVNFISILDDMPKNLDSYFLCFKPQSLNSFVFDFLDNSKVVSILAGTSIETIKLKFNNISIARLMPNTPSQISQGMNLIFFEASFTSIFKAELINLIESFGLLEVLNSESEIDLLTPFSACGPGIIFEFAQYFEEALKKIAPKDLDTHKLIAQTFLGTAMLMNNENKSFNELRDAVTSKKGVTQAAVESMRNNNLEIIMKKSFEAALLRIEELKRGI